MSLKAFLMNACRNFIVFVIPASRIPNVLKGLFNEGLQEFIFAAYAFKVAFRMSLKAFFNEGLQEFMVCLCPLSLIPNVLKGLF